MINFIVANIKRQKTTTIMMASIINLFENIPDWAAYVIRIYLLGGDVLEPIAVGYGIVWESGPLEVHKIAHKLVVGGIIVETACSVLLFAFDDGISLVQQSKIIALEQQIAYRTVDKEKFLAAISGKPKGRAEIQYVKWDQESLRFAMQIQMALSQAGWTLPSHPKPIDAIGWPRAIGDPMVYANPSSTSFGIPIPSSNVMVMAKSVDGTVHNLAGAINASTLSGCSEGTDPEMWPGDVIVMVGPRL
jgi:hypothetical protein